MFRSGNGEEQAAESINQRQIKALWKIGKVEIQEALLTTQEWKPRLCRAQLKANRKLNTITTRMVGLAQVFHDEATRQKDYFVY